VPVVAVPADRKAAQREAAIVTHVPGTTRDILELSLDIGGLPVSVADTAGLRESVDQVEQIGIERARRLYDPSFCNWRCAHRSSRCYRVQVTDASILVLSFPDAVSVTPSGPRLEIPAELAPLVTENTFILLNKTDLLPTTMLTAASSALPRSGCWAVSLASQSGTDEFLAGLATELQDRCDGFLNPSYTVSLLARGFNRVAC
jgi:tRNA modification GTPase